MHIHFILQYNSHFYCSALGAPERSEKGTTLSTPPICIAIWLSFVSQYTSHLNSGTFAKVRAVGVTAMLPTAFWDPPSEMSWPCYVSSRRGQLGLYKAQAYRLEGTSPKVFSPRQNASRRQFAPLHGKRPYFFSTLRDTEDTVRVYG